jgi:hypothetical protein
MAQTGDWTSGRACPLYPGISDINLLRNCQGVIDLDAEIPDRVEFRPECLGRSGGFAPVTLPLFHGTRVLLDLAWSYSSVIEDEEHVPLASASKSGQLWAIAELASGPVTSDR